MQFYLYWHVAYRARQFIFSQTGLDAINLSTSIH